MDGVSICITAYQAQDFIKETLDSVYSQTWFEDHDNWEVIVGIDGCKDTLDYVKNIMGRYDEHLRVLMMDSNKGTYVTTNTIMKEAKYDRLIRFDSDDVFDKNGIAVLMDKYRDFDFVQFKMRNFGLKNTISKSIGVHMIKKSVFDEFGGYRPWPCSADSEIIKRLKKFVSMNDTKEIIFYRRIHDNSLTRKEGETKLVNGAGNLRMKCLAYVKTMKVEKRKDSIILLKTNTFKEVFCDKYDREGVTYDVSLKLPPLDKVEREPYKVNGWDADEFIV